MQEQQKRPAVPASPETATKFKKVDVAPVDGVLEELDAAAQKAKAEQEKQKKRARSCCCC